MSHPEGVKVVGVYLSSLLSMLLPLIRGHCPFGGAHGLYLRRVRVRANPRAPRFRPAPGVVAPSWPLYFLRLAHLTLAAFRASFFRSSAVSDSMRLAPPRSVYSVGVARASKKVLHSSFLFKRTWTQVGKEGWKSEQCEYLEFWR